jgi:phage tail sheath protein FI
MPEYLAPGVYVEEVSFRSKSIEGVPTSTTGFAGLTRWGPVQYRQGSLKGPSATEPRLITSFTEFERVYGGLEPIATGEDAASAVFRPCYLGHAARAFFLNGGKRLYVSRVFRPREPGGGGLDWGIARNRISVPGAPGLAATWRARWPGSFGNVYVETLAVRTKNVGFQSDRFGAVQAKAAKAGSLVEIVPATPTPPKDQDPLDASTLAVVRVDPEGRQSFFRGTTAVTPGATDIIQIVTLRVLVTVDDERVDVYEDLAVDSDPGQKRFIGRILDKDHPADEDAVVWLDWDPGATGADGAQLAAALQTNANGRLAGGHDGDMPQPEATGGPNTLEGMEADLDHPDVKATGLTALGEIDDIAIVALPDSGTYGTNDECRAATGVLISHAENLRYRIAVVDAPQASSMTQVREFRGRFDSKYAALYHPWIEILDPLERAAQGAPPRRLPLPPSGFVAGIYARTDIERGVFKAPANEIVRGLTQFEMNINKGRNDVLNPEGINALRFFPGRGSRVWGARTMSSDPEWKYVNVRRLFIYLEHSIDKATQWAVFEPNNQRLWSNIQQTVADFLLVQWLNGALLGAKPEEAYFVRCDRTTMTQNDLDNGRLICLIGVAPTKPAEYVIFRIGQWTADSKVA